jgi:hypothetical protein
MNDFSHTDDLKTPELLFFVHNFLQFHFKNLNEHETSTLSEAVANYFVFIARRYMRAAFSYRYHENDYSSNGTDFDRYRDTFFGFVAFAKFAADWATVAFSRPESRAAGRDFLENTKDIYGFLFDLSMSGSRDTGLSGALEDQAAIPTVDVWDELRRGVSS